jgi:hypothetical protein
MLTNFEAVTFGITGYSIGKAQEATKTATEWAKKLTPAPKA